MLLNPFRRSYEANVLVVPLGESGKNIVEILPELGVEGVLALSDASSIPVQTSTIGPAAWTPPQSATIQSVAGVADMVVLVGGDLSQIPRDTVREVCQAARDGGDLIAAVLVAPQSWDTQEGSHSMVTLREEVDMLVDVKGPQLLAALLDVLRGGARSQNSLEEATEERRIRREGETK